MIEAGEAGSKRDTGDVVLDEAVDIDDSGSVAELHASHKHEDEGDYRVDGLQHSWVARLPRIHSCEGRGKLGSGQVDLRETETEPNLRK